MVDAASAGSFRDGEGGEGMSYTPEIMKVCVVDESGEAVATLEWMDSESIDVTLNGCCTNSKDWHEVSDAIQAAIIKMEQKHRAISEEGERMSRRARERANARPWEQDPEPEDHPHAGDFPEGCPDTDDMFGDEPDD